MRRPEPRTSTLPSLTALALIWTASAWGQTLFQDVTATAFPPERFPPGSLIGARSIAFGDWDNDGWPDLCLGHNTGPRLALWRNEHGRVFADASGTALPPHVQGPTKGGGTSFADYDNDGDLDLYVVHGSWFTAGTPNLLLRNDRGAFTDVTAAAGLVDSVGSDNAIWLDYDRDGLVDLYTGNTDGGSSPATRNHLYRNLGDGTFADATAEAGLDLSFHPQIGGSNGGMAAADFSDDGWPDLYVAVFEAPNRLFLNDGAGRFVEATTSEVADAGQAYGTAVADVDGDGRLDLFQAVGGNEESPSWHDLLLLNLGGGRFVDILDAAGLSSTSQASTLGVAAADVDDDGDVDLVVVEPHRLFLNRGDATFDDATASSGIVNTFQGLAFGDYDRDGRIDAAIANTWFGRVPPGGRLYRNAAAPRHWLRVELVGVESNRSAIGARLVLAAGGRRQTREILGGLGYTQDELVAHFGLGEHDRADELEVRWPSGRVEVLRDIPADRQVRVIEGHGNWYPAEPFPPVEVQPHILLADRTQRFQLRVRPALFEPGARVTGVVADLSPLGGPASAAFADGGDGTWLLATTVDPGPNAAHELSLWIDQATSVGPRWTRLSASVLVAPERDEALLSAGLEGGWRLGPPDTGLPKLGFVSDRDGVFSLEVADDDGANRVRLTRTEGHIVDPADFGPWRPFWDWSPDGRQVAVAADLDGRRAIWVVAVDGTGLRRLTEPLEGTSDRDPSWSPDGARIAFTSDRSGDAEIYVADLSGAEVRLTSSHGEDATPAWSPDGRRLAFSSKRDLDQGEGRGEIYVMDADGGSPVRLTHTPEDDWAPAWSPDGSRIAFVAAGPGFPLALIDADGGNQTSIPDLAFGGPLWGFTPAWSPDGSRIAAMSGGDIFTVRPDGTDFVPVTATASGEFIPRWLPDGAQLPVRVLNEPSPPAAFQGRLARQLTGDRVWLASYRPPAPVEPAGYEALAFAFHPGDAVLPAGGWLTVRVNDTQVDLLDGHIDVAQPHWQEVTVPLAAFRLDRRIEQIELSGVLRGPFHLADLRLVTAARGVGTAVAQDQAELPGAFALSQNYPNPFNAGTVIDFALPRDGQVSLLVYDALGQRVATLVSGPRPAGTYAVRWDGADDARRPLGSGVYLYRLAAGDRVLSRKLVLLR